MKSDSIVMVIFPPQDRTSHAGVQDAISNFQKAAGTFRYLHNHFTNAPSMDMQPHTLTMLIQLMMVSIVVRKPNADMLFCESVVIISSHCFVLQYDLYCLCVFSVLSVFLFCLQSQAQECVFECKVLNNSCEGLVGNVRAAQEAVVVSICNLSKPCLNSAKPDSNLKS